MKRIPETQRFETPRDEAREFDRHFDRIRSAGGEKYSTARAGEPLELRAQSLSEFDGAIAGKAARREGEFIQLRFDRRNHMRMRVADVMNIVAMKIHVAPTRSVFDEYSFRLADRRETRC